MIDPFVLRAFGGELQKIAELTPDERKAYNEVLRRQHKFEQMSAKGSMSDIDAAAHRDNTERIKIFRDKSTGRRSDLPSWVADPVAKKPPDPKAYRPPPGGGYRPPPGGGYRPPPGGGYRPPPGGGYGGRPPGGGSPFGGSPFDDFFRDFRERAQRDRARWAEEAARRQAAEQAGTVRPRVKVKPGHLAAVYGGLLGLGLGGAYLYERHADKKAREKRKAVLAARKATSVAKPQPAPVAL